MTAVGLQVTVRGSGIAPRTLAPGTAVRLGSGAGVDLHLHHPLLPPATVVAIADQHHTWWLTGPAAPPVLFVGGHHVTTVPIDRPMTVRLGAAHAGIDLDLAPVRMSAAGRRALPFVLAAVLVVVALVVTVLLVRQRGTGPDRAAPAAGAALDRAKAATVRLTMVDTAGTVLGVGSGIVVSDDGTILTNAHVAVPGAPGQAYLYGGIPGVSAPTGRPVDHLLVGVVQPGDDVPSQDRYRAEVLTSDGYLDLAVVRVTAAADGSPISGPLPWQPIPLADSRQLRTGDAITVLGFPTAVGSRTLTLTRGAVSTFVQDPYLRSPRGWVDTDARISPGNSGGPVVDAAGGLAGIIARGDAATTSQFRPIELAQPLLDRAGTTAVADTGADHLPAVTGWQAAFAGWSSTGRCDDADPSTALPAPTTAGYATFTVSGIPVGGQLFSALVAGGTTAIDLNVPPAGNRWVADAPGAVCAAFVVPALPAGHYELMVITDPIGDQPLGVVNFDVAAPGVGGSGIGLAPVPGAGTSGDPGTSGDVGTSGDPGTGDPGTSGDVAGLCRAGNGPQTWFGFPVAVEFPDVLGAGTDVVLDGGRGRLLRPIGDAAGYPDVATADAAAAAAVSRSLSVGSNPGVTDQRWSVLASGGRFYAVHAQHVDAFLVDVSDPAGSVPNPDLPCVLAAADATLVSFWAMTFLDGHWWSYHWVQGTGEWADQGPP